MDHNSGIVVWSKLLLYVVYRLVHLVLYSIYSVYWKLSGIEQHSKSSQKCLIFNIAWRRKAAIGDMSRFYDFLPIYVGIHDCNLLLDLKWTIYTVSEDYIWLVESDWTLNDYHARNCSFMLFQQYEMARRLARVHWNQFIDFTEKFTRWPTAGKIVYFPNCPRSGTTLLTRMLHCTEMRRPAIVAISETDIFTGVAYLKDEGRMGSREARRRLQSGLAFMCRNQRNDETFVFKTQSNGSMLIEDIDALQQDNIRIIFVRRRDTYKALVSCERMVKAEGISNMLLFAWSMGYHFAEWLLCFARYEYQMARIIQPTTALDIGFITYFSPLVHLARALENGVNLDIYYFEDIVNKPEQTITDILSSWNCYSEQNLEAALQGMSNDSQDGTVLSQNALKDIPVTEIDDSIKKRYNQFCAQLGIADLL